MRKLFVLFGLLILAMGLTYCSASKKARAAKNKTTYDGTLAAVIGENCTPCHIPSKGGNKKAYDNFENVKTDIDEMIRRIQLNPTDRGFMPFRKQAQLPAEVIAVFKKFKEDGTLEK